LSNLHALALKNRECPDIFHCIERVFFIIQDFWATSACPEKQSCPELFCCLEYTFYIQNLEQLALALKKTGCPEFPILNVFFYYSGFLSN